MSDTLSQLDEVLREGEAGAGLEFLIERFREEKEWPLVFEARLMKKRLEMGLPIIVTRDSAEFPGELRAEYEQAMVEAAREVGNGYLAMGNIPRAWPYFRAIGEQGPVREAMGSCQIGEDDVDAVIAIALQEEVAPAKGLRLIVERHGMCRALTTFGMYQGARERGECIALLTRELHAEVVRRLGSEIEAREGARPAGSHLVEMMAGRDGLFGEYDYYVDTSHLLSLLPYSLEVSERETLELLSELCAYGQRLATCFQPKGVPPFENAARDYGEFVLGMLGDNVDGRLEHFRKIAEEADPAIAGTAPAEFLVNFLVKLERYGEALEIAWKYLRDAREVSCPTAIQLCRMAGDYGRLKELARERNDLLSYVAAFEGK
jgi:hypothetical protein